VEIDYTRVRGPRPLMARVRRQKGVIMLIRNIIIIFLSGVSISCTLPIKIDSLCVPSSQQVHYDSNSQYYCSREVLDSRGIPLSEVKVTVMNKERKVIKCTYTMGNGKWNIVLEKQSKPVRFSFNKSEYFTVVFTGSLDEEEMPELPLSVTLLHSLRDRDKSKEVD
jgi:hypothetical protein